MREQDVKQRGSPEAIELQDSDLNLNLSDDNVEVLIQHESKGQLSPKPVSPRQMTPPVTQVKLAFLDLSHLSYIQQIGILALGCFVFFQGCAWIEEKTFKGFTDFNYAWFMTVVELLFITTFSGLERMQKNEPVWSHRVPLLEHFGIAVAMALARGLTNLSLQYVNYPTQVIFKSMKLLPIMIGSAICLQNRHTILEYIATLLLAFSATIFSLGDAEIETEFNFLGIGILLFSLLGDAAHSNMQERVVKKLEAGHLETMVYSNMFSMVLVLFISISIGEFFAAIRYCWEHNFLYVLWFLRAIVIYFGVQCLLLLVKVAGNVMANTIGTVRKILTILLSFYFFPKPWSNNYSFGLLIFLCSCGLNVYILYLKQKKDEEERARKAKEPLLA